ncbi:MAG: RNB domain-containing ribonuclease [Dermatophilaceae bacterium]
MSKRWIHLAEDKQAQGDPAAEHVQLSQAFDAVRAELKVPGDFPPEVLEEAQAVAAAAALPRRDETAVPFLTIDPPGSKDLDQAMFIERAGKGYRVRYAIADVPAFVKPGGAIDVEARKRGQTLYAPDRRTPLHPDQLGEDAASLLPDQVRPAFVWDMQLDSDGEGTSVDVYRAMMSSKNRFDYAQVQAAVERGTADERLSLLREVGERRIALEQDRGGASLPIPEQVVSRDQDGNYVLALRPPVPAEDWNAQISLLTGMAAAEMMLHAEIGILRTMPDPDHNVILRFRRQARALGVTWPAEMLYGELLRSLDRSDPKHLALIHAATSLFRGAGYTPFDGGVPELTLHAAVAAPYAHVTAPLRRLVDRFGLIVCESICSDTPVPDWVRHALPTLPEIMTASEHLANTMERACTDAVEAAAMQHRVGETFRALVVDVTNSGGLVQLSDPAILAHADGVSTAGTEAMVELVEADVATRSVRFQVVGGVTAQ